MMKSTFSKILKTVLGMQLALEGTCVSDIKPTVLEALMFAISREIIVSSLVIFSTLFESALVRLMM
jgi:hypothetical protein